MSKATFDRSVLTDVSWWHWLLTIPLLAAYLAGQFSAMGLAMILCAAAGGYFWVRIRQVKPYPVQVRIAYLGWLAVGMLPGMQWMHWIQLCGTTAMVTVGYCPLIRLLSLAPYNRSEPLTGSYVWNAFFQEPCSGGLVNWNAGAPTPGLVCCAPPAKNSLSCSVTNPDIALKEFPNAQAH